MVKSLLDCVSLTYKVGWFNIEMEQHSSWRRCGVDDSTTTIHLLRDLYGFEKLQSIITKEPFGPLNLSIEDGLITLTNANGIEFRITDELLSLFELDDGRGGEWINNDNYTGDRPVILQREK